MQGVLGGTLVLWVLNALLIQPLASWSVGRRLAAEGITGETLAALPGEARSRWQSMAVWHYILWDVAILAVAGFIGGLMGYWFLGISFEAKGWPGILAFIGASFLGLALNGGGPTGAGY